MTTLTEFAAVVVMHSAAVALSHFGVTMDPAHNDHAKPVAERVVAKTPRRAERLSSCPQQPRQRERAPVLKV